MDRTPLTPEQRRLAADPGNLRMARAIAARAGRSAPPHRREEYEAAALMGLVEAARDYDPAAGFAFSTYAAPRIRGAVLECMRGAGLKGYKRDMASAPGVAHLSRPVASGEGGWPMTLADAIPSGELPVGWEVEAEDAVLALTRDLPRWHADAVRARFLNADAARVEGWGRRLGIPWRHAYPAYHQGLDMIRAGLAGERRSA